MKHTIRQTAKGYIINVKEGRRKYTYFLWDEQHTKERYIEYILKYNQYKIGEPFGDNIYPIYVDYTTYKKIDADNHPTNVIIRKYKMCVIWTYYRSFVTEDTKPKVLKQYANELKSNLKLLGLDGLYKFVQAQA